MLSNEERENIVLNRTEQDRVDVGTSLYNIIEIGLIEKECGYDYDGIEYCYYPQYKMLREDSACITEVESIDDALWLLSKIRAKGYFHVSGNYDSLLDCLIEEEQNECC